MRPGQVWFNSLMWASDADVVVADEKGKFNAMRSYCTKHLPLTTSCGSDPPSGQTTSQHSSKHHKNANVTDSLLESLNIFTFIPSPKTYTGPSIYHQVVQRQPRRAMPHSPGT